eukprot:Sdes_comp16084_c0_seq1m5287
MKAESKIKVRRARKSSSKITKKKPPLDSAGVTIPGSVVDLSKWRPIDDVVLINAVQQVPDLLTISKSVNFSRRYSLEQISERWNALLYDPIQSRRASAALSKLDPSLLSFLTLRSCLWSYEEEDILKTLKPNSNPQLEDFENLLIHHRGSFHRTRTSKSLHSHWLLLNHFHLLDTEKGKLQKRFDVEHPEEESFSDFERHHLTKSKPSDSELLLSRPFAAEMDKLDRQEKRKIKETEEMVLMTEEVAADSSSKELAVLKGSNSRYAMCTKEIILGRNTSDNMVDFDLSEEGPAMKASRRQASIKLKSDGEFYITNLGKRPISVSSKIVERDSKRKLPHMCLIEICDLKFVFEINISLVRKLRHML